MFVKLVIFLSVVIQISNVATASKLPANIGSVTTDLLPDISICGQGNAHISDGIVANLDEFPWVALLEYEKPSGERHLSCDGVLISDRYVLTVAHCVAGTKFKIVSVRLGEYNTNTDTDCIKTSIGENCASPPVNIPVEQVISHEDYDKDNFKTSHDIALLRLDRKVNFTDYVRPICLPTTAEELGKTYIGQKLFVAGWGKLENRSLSNIKLKEEVTVKQQTECSNRYQQANVKLGDGQLCAGDGKGRDNCRGKGGAPLMVISGNKSSNWYTVGLSSFGPSPCGQENLPGVFTNVSKYVPWIVSKLSP